MAYKKDSDKNQLFEEKSALEQAMVSEENEREGNVVTGGAEREISYLEEEKEIDEQRVLSPPDRRDGKPLLDFLRGHLHEFTSPHSYIGGEANSPDRSRFHSAEVRILIARLSTYEATSLSMSHSMMAQIYQELPYTFCDIAFLPLPNDYKALRENGFPVWFGTNTKLGPSKFDFISITHAVSMEQLNFIPLLYDSGIPIFKDQRMEREDVPLIIVGGMNSGTTAPLCGDWRGHSCFYDAVIYGDGEVAAKDFVEVVREGKQKGWTKREILRACHGRVAGFYEPDCYEHIYDGKGVLVEIRKREGRDYAALPVRRAIVNFLGEVRTLETKILPYSGDGASVDVAIAGSVGCIGSGGLGACSFCREGSEGPYRERPLDKVLGALDAATRNQGTKEVSFFSLNFNQYTDLFPLVLESVKKGYKVGLISQRVDMLAQEPEQIRVQRWLKKANFTLGVEGISERMRCYLNKNLEESQLLKVIKVFMEEGAAELKLFYIATGLEDESDMKEFAGFADKVEQIKAEGGWSTHIRASVTPLFPSAFTALQFAPALAAMEKSKKNLTPMFEKCRELGWGRRLSVSGEEPLVSNTINHGGRNVTGLLIDSFFKDGYVFYGTVPKGTWERWNRRIVMDPNINLKATWGEKTIDYIFPWEDIGYSTSKGTLWKGYLKAKAYVGIKYCLTTNAVRGECNWQECGCCDTLKVGKPVFEIIQLIVNRKVAPAIPSEKMAALARSREKKIHLRVLFDVKDPIYRYVAKSYFEQAIPRALMLVSDELNDAYVGSLGNARSACGAKDMIDWTFGKNIYDFSLSNLVSEATLRDAVEKANEVLREGSIAQLRTDSHLTVLRNEVDYAIYSILIPSSAMGYGRIRDDVKNFFERKELGKTDKIKVKVAKGKGAFRTEEQFLGSGDVRMVTCRFEPALRGTMLRAIVSARYNPMSLLESITGRRSHTWKEYPIYCDGYVQLPEDTGEEDVFSMLSGGQSRCRECNGLLETDIFTGEPLKSGVCLACDMDQLSIDPEVFFVEEMEAVGA